MIHLDGFYIFPYILLEISTSFKVLTSNHSLDFLPIFLSDGDSPVFLTYSPTCPLGITTLSQKMFSQCLALILQNSFYQIFSIIDLIYCNIFKVVSFIFLFYLLKCFGINWIRQQMSKAMIILKYHISKRILCWRKN